MLNPSRYDRLPLKGRRRSSFCEALADAIVLEIGYAIAHKFRDTVDMDRQQWFAWVFSNRTCDDLIEAINSYLEQQWLYELDQALILEIAYQICVDHRFINIPSTREMFMEWCCATRISRNQLIEMIEQPGKRRVH